MVHSLAASYADLDTSAIIRWFIATCPDKLQTYLFGIWLVCCDAILLQGLRDMCTAEGAVLCFDEVMTGFRIARGCAQVRMSPLVIISSSSRLYNALAAGSNSHLIRQCLRKGQRVRLHSENMVQFRWADVPRS
jgi:hypothetical protein